MEEIEGTNKSAVESCHTVLNLLSRLEQQDQVGCVTKEAVSGFKRVGSLLSGSVGHTPETDLSLSIFLEPCHQKTELASSQKQPAQKPELASSQKSPVLLSEKPPVLRSGFPELSLRLPSETLTLGTKSYSINSNAKSPLLQLRQQQAATVQGKNPFDGIRLPSSMDPSSQLTKRKCLMKGDEHGGIKCGSSSKCHRAQKRKLRVRRSVKVPAISNKDADIPPDGYSWRKYGQKPINGSPHPKGYYKCSSVRGCPARKHVQRCLENPSMLNVTYEGEHNHPNLQSQAMPT